MNEDLADRFVERAAILLCESCTCDPRPSSMRACTCGERDLAEQTAALMVGVNGWNTNPAVSQYVRKWEADLWRR